MLKEILVPQFLVMEVKDQEDTIVELEKMDQ